MTRLLTVLILLTAACVQWPARSATTRAFDRDPHVYVPAIHELATSEREEAEAVLVHIAADPDELRRRTAEQALKVRRKWLAERAAATPARAGAGALPAGGSSSAGGGEPSSAVPATVHAEIASLNRSMEDALRRGDLAGVAAVYADDGVLLSRDGTRYAGREEVDAYWGRLEGARDWQLSVDRVEGEGGLWVQRGTSRLTVERDGELRVSEVDFLLVWVREADGRLRIALDAYW